MSSAEFRQNASEKVSVLILTQNNQKTLRRTLDSVKGFAEVVIVDGGSTDQTLQIAAEYSNVAIHQNPWPGFIEQRNLSVDRASHRWCFMLDSDEVCTPELQQEIERVINNSPTHKMYAIMRTEYFCQKEVENAHGKSAYQERLFLRDHVRYTGSNHHSHLIDGELSGGPFGAKVSRFPKHLRILHDDSYSIDDWIIKMPRFAILVGNEKLDKGRKAGAAAVLLAFFGTFLRIYAKSFREGRLGFAIAVSTAINRCLIRLYIYCKTHLEERDVDYVKKSLG